MKKNIKLGLGVLILALTFLLSFYFLKIFPQKKEKLPPLSNPKTFPTTTPPKLDQKYCYTLPEKERNECLDWIKYDNEIFPKLDFDGCEKLLTEKVKERCKKAIARRLQNPDLCFKLKEKEDQEYCLHDIIMDKRDPALCEKYHKDDPWELRECQDRIKAFLLPETMPKEKIVECIPLVLEYKNLCFNHFLEKKFNFNCEEVPKGEAQDYCLNLKVIEEVTLTQNPEVCSNAQGDVYKKYCQKIAKLGAFKAAISDDDGDGMTTGDELFYSLDPYNPDTDGDGFKDGEEILNHMDPKDPKVHPPYFQNPIAIIRKIF